MRHHTTRKIVRRKSRRSPRRPQKGGEGSAENIDGYIFVNLLESTPELRNMITEHMRVCWPESTEVEDMYESVVSRGRHNVFLIYRRDGDALVFSRMISLAPEKKAINIDLTCVSPSHRGKGYYKSSLVAMRKRFDPEEYKYIENRAEVDTIGNIDHTKRLEVFHKLGYRLNPLAQIGPEGYVPMSFKLKSGEIVQLLTFDETAAEPSYKVLTRNLKEKVVKLTDIDRCLMPNLEVTSLIFDDGSKNGKQVLKKDGEKWEMTDDGIVVDGTIYPWAKIRRRIAEPAEGNRFSPSSYGPAYCSLIMPF